MKDLSKLTVVKPDQGKAQWVECQVTGIAKDEAKRTHLVGIPPLMPCTTIFVHGVNSDGEWYRDAAEQLALGLRKRLGRSDLEQLEIDEADKRRFRRVHEKSDERYLSPILPFYWGYKVPPEQRIKLVDSARTGDRPDTWADRFGNPLRPDGSWGGGPFQNGTHSLLQFWQPGFDKTIGPMDVNRATALRMKVPRLLRRWIALALPLIGATLLTACSLGGLGGPYPGVPALSDAGRAQPYTGEVAAPQVAYRIDENRYFEIVPRTAAACHTGDLYYTDRLQGIHSYIYPWQPGYNLRSTFVIDASNDQYLVAPVTRGNTDCSSGGGLCGGSKLPYSTDGGRTWKRGDASSASDDISVSGSVAYAIGNVARRVDLAVGISSLKDWKSVPGYQPNPRKPPLDTKFRCTVNGKE